MVLCISQTCGSLSDSSTTVHQEKQMMKRADNRKSFIKHKMKPYFTCLGRPANLTKVKYDVHPSLAALWDEAEEWHLLSSDHCDVYGFNLWSPAWLKESTEMVFDGSEGRRTWLKTHKNQVFNLNGKPSSIPSCAAKGWVCCMAFSEFDYLLICLQRDSPTYGNVHHINTHSKKECFIGSMDDLLFYLASFLEEGESRKKESTVYRDNRRPSSASLPRSLRLIRKAVIDAVSR